MPVAEWIAFGCLAALALAHSALGEAAIIRPLLHDRSWSIPAVPRSAADPLLRFAWHLTSLAWLGLGATLVGASVSVASAVVCLASGALIVVLLRGHLAWPLFLLGGLAALDAGGHLGRIPLVALIGAGVVVATGAAVVHLYWAFGGRRGLAAAVPSGADGQPLFRPGPAACAFVAFALGVFGALLVSVALAVEPKWTLWLLAPAALLLVIRAVGDGKRVGFTKQDHASTFGRLDDAVYTPLVVVLAFGALASLRLTIV